ncbi:UPF0602 protein C4orf47 homolog [Venturia canescens]|uniref:UPF0602 protein C4orf47 homolog n=1 Tax=Venturia canescens TaxID=32260 RepID=UPI001C9CC341|nr:UPF0602 protein C4orf47 homolog [Venturia canescens]
MTQKRGKFEVNGDTGRHYGKFDLDRVGFFDDSPNGPFDVYVQKRPTARSDFKGRQLLAGPGNDLIEKDLKRIFDGEAIQHESREKKKSEISRGRPMLPPSPTKIHSTPNDWYGCIGPPPDYFSPEVREIGDKKKRAGGGAPNCKIKPNPLGGPGYLDICINPYPKHSSEPYSIDREYPKGGRPRAPKFLVASSPLEYFPPNPYVELETGPTYVRRAEDDKSSKMIGPGRFYVPFPKKLASDKFGGFTKFEYTSEPYHDKKKDVRSSKASGLRFVGGGPTTRTKYTNSIINQVTGISCNVKNFKEYRQRVYSLPN